MKAHRVGERRAARNRPVRSALRTFVKKARTGIVGVARGTAEEAAALVAEAAKELDKAASKGIIHKNQAARRKGRLMHQLAVVAKAAAARAEAPAEEAPRPTRRRAAAAAPAPEKKPAAPRATRARAPKAEAPAEKAEEKPAPRPRTRRTEPKS
jgi:small subunit ribosomal protein S20